MKTKILISLLVIISCMTYSQDYLSYDFEKAQYNTGKKELENNKEYIICVENINPFYYKVSLQVTQKDKVKEVFDLIRGTISGKTLEGNTQENSSSIDLKNTFELLYRKALLIEVSLKNSYILYETKEDIKMYFKEQNILYKAYIEFLDSNKNAEIIKQYNKAEVEKLNVLMNEAYDFIVNQRSILTLGKITTQGTDYTFQLTFTPPEENVKNESEKKDISIFTSKNKIKVYFSTGILVANPLKSEYYVSEKNSDNKYSIFEEKRGNYSLGIMTLAHFMCKLKNEKSKTGINLGAGFDLDKQLRFLLGGSIMVNNIVLSLGYNWAYQNELSDKYLLNTEYTEKPEIIYKKVLKGGIWFGISYNIP